MIVTQVDIIRRDIRIMMVTIDSTIGVVTVVRDRNLNGNDWVKYDRLIDHLIDAKKSLEYGLDEYKSLEG